MNGRTLIRLLLPTLTVALAAAACTKDLSHSGLDPESPAASEAPIEFAVGGGTKGQAPITTLSALAEQDFSVSAWYSPQGETFDVPGGTAVKYITNHRFGYVTSDLAGETTFPNPWQGVAPHASAGMVNPNPVYWPLDGTLTFFSYAPYRADAALETLPVPDTRDIVLEPAVTDAGIISRLPGYLIGSPLIRYTPAASARDQADFLTGRPVLDASRLDDGGRFSLNFDHRLTQVKFAFNYEGELHSPEFICVTDIEIQNIISSAYLYYIEPFPYETNCKWSSQNSLNDPFTDTPLPSANFTISETDGELLSGSGAIIPERNGANDNHLPVCTDDGILFLLPQTLSVSATLQISYVVCEQHGVPLASEVVSVPLKTASMEAWPVGKQVRYLLTLNIPNHQVSGITAQYYEWEDAGNTHAEEQLLPHTTP